MADDVTRHYDEGRDLVESIAAALRAAGKDMAHLTTSDLRAVDEFHIRGHKATLELAARLQLGPGSQVLDMGSGLGGPARTLAETSGCHVTGVDLTKAYCDAATTLSAWVGLADRVAFRQGDATRLPFADASFDAAVTIHVAMNIPAKDQMYREAHRVLKPDGRFAIYDVLQGEGGAALLPVPWAREPSISHLVTPQAMEALLREAGFKLLEVHDSSEEGRLWFEEMAARGPARGAPAVTLQLLLGADFPLMVRNMLANLKEHRIRTVSYLCEA